MLEGLAKPSPWPRPVISNQCVSIQYLSRSRLPSELITDLLITDYLGNDDKD